MSKPNKYDLEQGAEDAGVHANPLKCAKCGGTEEMFGCPKVTALPVVKTACAKNVAKSQSACYRKLENLRKKK